MKRYFTALALALLALIPRTVLGDACNADNCLRALRRYSAEASAFCSTYTTTSNTATTALPTYATPCSYSTSRLSSACTCLDTTTTTTTSSSTTPPVNLTTKMTLLTIVLIAATTTTTTSTTSAAPTYVCCGELITNGDFSSLTDGNPDPWVLAPPTSGNGQSTSVTVSNGGVYVYKTQSLYNPNP